MTRREIREHLLKLLYMRDFYERSEIPDQNTLYFEGFYYKLTKEERATVLSRYEEVVSHLGDIDPIIADATSGWALDRIGRIELNILRLAVFEIRYDDDVPSKVAINEAVDLAKSFGGEDSSYGFINGILAKVI